MLVVLVWIIALVLAIPTYGISIVVAIFINIALAKVANSALTTTSVLTNENIPIDVKIQQLYLNYCQTVHHKTFYSWQYNRYLLLEALGYAMKRLDGDQILSFDVVYAYQKSKGLNSGDRIDYDFLDFIILDIKRMMKFHPKNKAELEKLIENQEINLGDIDTSAITDMSELFAWSGRKDFSGIESWDVSGVTNMSWMFKNCENFNQPLNNWNVSSVIYMNSMFSGCENFNQPLNNWNVSSVIYMSSMFADCKNFNQPLDNWNVSSVTDMSLMFFGCYNFNQPLNNWRDKLSQKLINQLPLIYFVERKIVNNKTRYYPKTKDELESLVRAESLNLGDIDTSAITDMSNLFYESERKDFSGIENWDVSSVVNMSGMFRDCKNFNQPLDNWDVSSVTDMSDMFDYCENFNQPLNSWDVSSVTNMSRMFVGCKNFNQPLDNWDVSSVTNMSVMFADCKNFNQPLDNWDVSSVTDMSMMFYNCENFNQPLNNWDVSSVTNMRYMFRDCENFNQPLDNWDVSSVTDMTEMFYNCYNFNQPLNNWDVSSVTDMSWMFDSCKINDENKPKFVICSDEIPF